MFRHQGKNRTAQHNLQIASLLSFVAGIVNVAGFLSVQRLTTNVTGHFAYLIEAVFEFHFLAAFVFLLYLFFFFLGSFISSFLVEYVALKNVNNTYIYPIIIEIIIFCVIPLFGKNFCFLHPNIIACGLLFAMGLQNSLVTKISNASVRTTHLTGLFTDLGIEISQLIFQKDPEKRTKLFSSIKLRFIIIGFFFMGGIFSAFLYQKIQLNVLVIASFLLIFGLIYDKLKLKIASIKSKNRFLNSAISKPRGEIL